MVRYEGRVEHARYSCWKNIRRRVVLVSVFFIFKYHIELASFDLTPSLTLLGCYSLSRCTHWYAPCIAPYSFRFVRKVNVHCTIRMEPKIWRHDLLLTNFLQNLLPFLQYKIEVSLPKNLFAGLSSN